MYKLYLAKPDLVNDCANYLEFNILYVNHFNGVIYEAVYRQKV